VQRLIHSNRIRWAGKNRCRAVVVVVVMMLVNVKIKVQ